MWALQLRAELGQQVKLQRISNTHKYQIMSENNKVVVPCVSHCFSAGIHTEQMFIITPQVL